MVVETQTQLVANMVNTVQAQPSTLTFTPIPSATITAIYTSTAMPKITLRPTITIEATPTAFVVTLAPVTPSSSNLCSCTNDKFDCKDFSSQHRAQACYNYCVSLGVGDIHALDNDNDGKACESLPQ